MSDRIKALHSILEEFSASEPVAALVSADDARLLLATITEQEHAIGRLVAIAKTLHDAIYEFADAVPDDQPYHHDDDNDERNLECTMRDVAWDAENRVLVLGLTWEDDAIEEATE